MFEPGRSSTKVQVELFGCSLNVGTNRRVEESTGPGLHEALATDRGARLRLSQARVVLAISLHGSS